MVRRSAVVFLLVFVAIVFGLLSGIAGFILATRRDLDEYHFTLRVRRLYSAYYHRAGRGPESTTQLRGTLAPKFRDELDEALRDAPTKDFEFVISRLSNGDAYLVGIFRYSGSTDSAVVLIGDDPPTDFDEMFIADGRRMRLGRTCRPAAASWRRSLAVATHRFSSIARPMHLAEMICGCRPGSRCNAQAEHLEGIGSANRPGGTLLR